MSDIYASSRYYNSTVDFISFARNSDIYPFIIYQPDVLVNISYKVHVVIEGERLDQLSFRYFNRPDMWWAIVEYNPEIRDFFNIPAGTLLRIPNV